METAVFIATKMGTSASRSVCGLYSRQSVGPVARTGSGRSEAVSDGSARFVERTEQARQDLARSDCFQGLIL